MKCWNHVVQVENRLVVLVVNVVNGPAAACCVCNVGVDVDDVVVLIFKHDELKLEGVLVDVDVVMLDALGDGVLELICADVVEDVD
eukprot:153790-Amphidinium_carterae.1